MPRAKAPSNRILSLMTSAWSKGKNGLNLETLELELMITQNFGMNCSQLQIKRELRFLGEMKSSDKY